LITNISPKEILREISIILNLVFTKGKMLIRKLMASKVKVTHLEQENLSKVSQKAIFIPKLVFLDMSNFTKNKYCIYSNVRGSGSILGKKC
jgi:hypothetical protein